MRLFRRRALLVRGGAAIALFGLSLEVRKASAAPPGGFYCSAYYNGVQVGLSYVTPNGVSYNAYQSETSTTVIDVLAPHYQGSDFYFGVFGFANGIFGLPGGSIPGSTCQLLLTPASGGGPYNISCD
jgi:hypothetical protein